MIGVVIVSHSRKLAEGVRDLAGQVGRGNVRITIAGGASGAEDSIGTDAVDVLAAIEAAYTDDGVLVLMDLGSAVLSAETALEFLPEHKRSHVQLCPAPLVEGAVAAVTLAAAGASLAEIVREAQDAHAPKRAQLGIRCTKTAGVTSDSATESRLVTVPNELGLHARPAARLIRIGRGFRARITVQNVTINAGPADAGSMNAILTLGARKGHRLSIAASGEEAARATAAIAAFIESGCGDAESVAETSPGRAVATEVGDRELAGTPAAPGVAIGPLVKLNPVPLRIEDRPVDDPDGECGRLRRAIQLAQDETRVIYEWADSHLGQNQAAIFDAQLLFLEDPELLSRASRMIREERHTAEFAWSTATRQLTEDLLKLEDPYLQARAADLADIGNRVLRALTGSSAMLARPDRPSILSAHNLTPSEVQNLDPAVVLGLCMETGSATAHSAILARAMGIPCVVGLGPAIAAVPDGTTVAIDANRGVVLLSPGPEEVRTLDDRRQAWLAQRRTAELEREEPACTSDGHRIRVFANLNRASDVVEALTAGAEGIGVLRTEFLFVGRESAPSEDEQYAAYRTIAQALGPRTLVVRTLDIGGDKRVPFVDAGDEANPFLGWRGIRVTLSRRDLLRTQLRAILRAGHGYAVEVLIPMISSLVELRIVKAVLQEVADDLKREGVPIREDLPIGVMVEVPSAVAIAGELAREATRLSIGTNDLVQYVMATDRTNARVAKLADHFQPAVLRMIRDTVRAGRSERVCVDVCGEMAADPLATPLLIAMGVEELSVSPVAIPELKQAIRRWSMTRAQSLLEEALVQDSAESVRDLLLRRLTS